MYIGSSGFKVSGSRFTGNAAHLGGGLFLAADLSTPDGTPALQYLEASRNAAARGPWAFW
jgi:hypothetical protein